MTKFFLVPAAALALTLAIAAPTLASDDGARCGQTTGQWMSLDEARSKVAGMGYDVRKIKREDGCYEVYAIDANGARVEIYLHPVSGEIVKSKNKS